MTSNKKQSILLLVVFFLLHVVGSHGFSSSAMLLTKNYGRTVKESTLSPRRSRRKKTQSSMLESIQVLRGGFMSGGEFFTDAGFVAAVVAPIVKSEILLRSVSLSSSLFFLTSALWLWPKVNWVSVVAQFVFIARASSLLKRAITERRVTFTTDEIRIYEQLFDDLQLHEYRALLNAGSKVVCAEKDEVLVAENASDWGFMVLTKGTCKVMRKGRQIDTLEPGDTFGDKLSIAAKGKDDLQDKLHLAKDTIIADSDDGVEYLSWDTTDILQMMAQRVAVRAAVLSIVARDEARKINRLDWDDVQENTRRWFQPAFLPPVPVAQIPNVLAEAVVDVLAPNATNTDTFASSNSSAA
mmetsp:Transcript_5194/g.7712  ORF Transcript_5194/g.7712 Transcript_5194/m.7712 type:complete len:354 (-) Transcript_5194:157-1218(-)